MNVLVTGGAGFIGSHCVDQLLAAGHQVTVLDIKTQTEAVNLHHCLSDITYIESDVRRFADVVAAMQDCTHVLHFAAIVSVPESIEKPLEAHETNVTGTQHVFEAARQGGIERVVYASSAAVYGDNPNVPLKETEPLAPLSPYGLHKVSNEQLAALYNTIYNVPMMGLRFFNVYGVRQDPSSPYSGVISKCVAAVCAAQAPVIFGDGSATRDFVYVEDVAAVCIALLEDVSRTGVLNVGTGTKIAIKELMHHTIGQTDHDLEPKYEAPRPGDIVHSHADITALHATTATPPKTDLLSGLKKLIHG